MPTDTTDPAKRRISWDLPGSDPLSGINTESLWCSQQAYSFLTDQVIYGDKQNASKMYLQGRLT
jgi:hypothetical protein